MTDCAGIFVKPTPTLIRLHISQGYLASARRMVDAYRKVGDREMARQLDLEWEAAAVRVRREASVMLLERLAARVRRNRSQAT